MIGLSNANVAAMLGVIQLHRNAVEDIQASAEFAYLKDEARRTWDRALARGKQVALAGWTRPTKKR